MSENIDTATKPQLISGVVPLPSAVLQEYRKRGVLPEENIGHALSRTWTRYASRTALISPEVRWTYRELDELTDRAGASLLKLGLRPLDRVIFQVTNVAELFLLLYGSFKAGIVPVCTLASYREREIEFLANFTSARAHFVQADLPKFDIVKFARGIKSKVDSLEYIVSVRGQGQAESTGGLHSLEFLMTEMDPVEAREILERESPHPDEIALFLLSGGTTGIPKIIPRFHAEYIHNSLCYAEAAGYTSASVAHWPLPAIHNAAMIQFNLPVHLTGGSLVVQPSHQIKDFLGLLEREKVTHTGAALPLIVRAIDSGALENHDLSSIEDFVSLGESELVDKELHLPFNHVFGMAEGLCMRTRKSDPNLVRLSMIGKPISPYDEVRLVDPVTGKDVTVGKTGEFWARGPYTLRGYYNAAEHNSERFSDDGFYKSGDLMRAHIIAGETYYSFEGRLKDNIDRGMEKINAEELEREIIQLESVLEVYCVAMPDLEYGEKVCAYIIPATVDTGFTVESLGKFLESRGVAKFKWPERIELVDTFPVTKLGKTSKALMREDVTRKLVASAKLPKSFLEQFK